MNTKGGREEVTVMTTYASTQQQERERAAWDHIAEGFDRHVTPLSSQLAEQALDLAGLRPGMRFLDVAAGSGALSIPAARRGAHVTATDYSPAMVERLAARAQAAGLSEVESHVMDGLALDLADDTFDVSGSQNGVSVFPDLTRGLAELVRVTRPGGRALLVAFGAPIQETEFIAFVFGALRAAVPGFTPPLTDPPPPPFQLTDPEKMRHVLADASLTDVRVETVDWPVEIRSAAHLWNVTTSGHPIVATLVSGLTEEQRGAVRQVLDGMLLERSGGRDVAVLNNRMNVGVGTK
jgi:ubiquinone/menaquinone biosynthesis C-methylase UbiE